jgi:formamidopyrimidine-DNA glycosylase
MPELPEVETVRLGLAALLPHKKVAQVTHNWPKSFPNAPQDVQQFLIGATITNVRRRAKVLLIDLNTNYTLVIHLKMTGQLVFKGDDVHFGAGHPSDSLVHALPDASTRVIITFTNGSTLFFNDQRKFGWMRLLPTAEVMNLDFFKKVGPEPLGDSFTAADFIARLQRRKNSGIKAVLLDQTVVAGVGNIYADESLYAAKIHPAMRVADVPPAKLRTLYAELRRILRLSIKKGGSTDRNYVDAHGKKGSYLSFAKVFRKQGQPCPRCHATIIKIKVAGRGTHICPFCQKLPSKKPAKN